MLMMGKPLPAGHTAQARVAPLPDARGWSALHTAEHKEHRFGLQLARTCCLQVISVSICSFLLRPAMHSACRDVRKTIMWVLTRCVTKAHGHNTTHMTSALHGHLLQLTAALAVSGWCAELWAGDGGAGVRRGLHLFDGRAHCIGTQVLTVGGHK